MNLMGTYKVDYAMLIASIIIISINDKSFSLLMFVEIIKLPLI